MLYAPSQRGCAEHTGAITANARHWCQQEIQDGGQKHNINRFCGGDCPPSPPFAGGLELGGRVWETVKVLHIKHNLFAGTETLPLSIYKPIAIRVLWGGVTVPHLGERVWLGGHIQSYQP
jgi:hypothetical protein